MTLKSKMEKNKFYSIARSTKVIKKGEVYTCLTSTQFETVDSLPKLYDILKNLHKLSHRNNSKEFEDWKQNEQQVKNKDTNKEKIKKEWEEFMDKAKK